MTTASQCMTRDAITVGPSDTIRQAAMMMADLKVGSLPVCDGQKLIGTVTDRDIAVRAVASGVEPTAPVREIASHPLEWCYEDDNIEDVKHKMADAQIRRVPVLDREKRLVGIVALGDVATGDSAGAGSTLKAVSQPAGPDR
ncbi:CBS domain-containing protein YhcV [Paraburkholderia kururiensis]|uniref:CBS domain-containing protein n=1 Tax=Paraburkholderia kururiensis TaxID=984307 RepID=UPI0039A66E19